MRRLIATLALGAALPLVVFFGVGADDDGGGYKVRAIFDNVTNLVEGEDVRIAGAKVGVVDSLDVADRTKAAIVLNITDNRFTPFRKDAKCTVRALAVIAEKFVECSPGSVSQPELAEIKDGDGKGQRLLPVQNTSSPVDADLANNIMRRPFRERFSILIGEFGAGVAGRGEELKEAIHRANPALRETDKVLKILARQNRVLAKLARDSDEALAPLAREKRTVTSWIEQANATGEATAERRADIEEGIRKLPGFLRELKPTMTDLGAFADQAAPVARDLNTAGRDISRGIEALGPFSKASTPAVDSLGEATKIGRPIFIKARPVLKDLRGLASNLRPISNDLDRLSTSLDETGGVERLMDFLYYSMLAINGYDDVGHYLRAALLANTCTSLVASGSPNCSANFLAASSSSTRAAKSGDAARIAGAGTAKSNAGSVPPQGDIVGSLLGKGRSPEGKENVERIKRQARQGSPALQGNDEPMLDYLLGSDR
jgi:ABC-type transporter Mla subunit MlaD